ncbi:hypothetical protein BD779DRAFT_1475757 [Infundibulicybe gibba]|nr:hypothetical protein BD779DRAFT_1475757 [Infundibulicybe gibba]
MLVFGTVRLNPLEAGSGFRDPTPRGLLQALEAAGRSQIVHRGRTLFYLRLWRGDLATRPGDGLLATTPGARHASTTISGSAEMAPPRLHWIQTRSFRTSYGFVVAVSKDVGVVEELCLSSPVWSNSQRQPRSAQYCSTCLDAHRESRTHSQENLAEEFMWEVNGHSRRFISVVCLKASPAPGRVVEGLHQVLEFKNEPHIAHKMKQCKQDTQLDIALSPYVCPFRICSV